MTVYRKRTGTNVFHWSKFCPSWPGNSFDQQILKEGTRPTGGKLCPECLKREKEGKGKKERT